MLSIFFSRSHGTWALKRESFNPGGIVKDFKKGQQQFQGFDNVKEVQYSFHYRYCYQKCLAFLLTDYNRVISMDSDGFPMQDLDHLFFLADLTPEMPIAAPQGYWFDNEGLQFQRSRKNCIGNSKPN